MTEVVGIKFKGRGKVYYFDPAGIKVRTGDSVVVETTKGLELGECARGNYEVPDEQIVPPLRCVVRVATENDLRTAEMNKKREKEAFAICKERIAAHGLAMKLVDVEYNFEGNKILFFFTSDGRVDFRELVKDLAGIFRTRIELRQIGVRDEAKMLGGIGICGRPYCCGQFLDDFEPVSTKMAKTQSMSLNPTKISGSCGRLMCCLRYEQDAYVDLLKSVPKAGAYVETPDGYGAVAQVNLLRQKVKVRLDGMTDAQQGKVFDALDVAVVPGGRPKPGETPPSVLKPREKPAEETEEPELSEGDSWYLEGTPVSQEKLDEKIAALADSEAHRRKRPNRRRGGRGKGRGGDREEASAAEKPERTEQTDRASGHGQRQQKKQQPQGGAPRQNGNPQKRSGSKPHPKPDGEGAQAKQQRPPKPQRSAEASGTNGAQGGENAARHGSSHHRRRSGKPKPQAGNPGAGTTGE